MLLLAHEFERDYEYLTFVVHPEMQILTVLAGIAHKYGKGYCYPSQRKILELMRRYGRQMSLRALNRHLNQLVRLGYIKRQRRHTHDTQNGYTFRSSCYVLKRRALKWLAGMAAAAQRAFDFVCTSRVPNSAHYSQTKRIIPEARPQSGHAPPGSLESGPAGDASGPEDKEKAVGFTHLSKIRALLHV